MPRPSNQRPSNQLTLSFLKTTGLQSLTIGGSQQRRTLSDFPDFEPEPEEIELATLPDALPAVDFRLTNERTLGQGWKTRAADNLAAIRLAQSIEDEKRNATPDEQRLLAKFVSFGASELANNMFRRAGEAFPSGWDDLGNELEQLVTKDELSSLARVTQYAHFTPEFIIKAIWAGLQHMGFTGGRILEPGCGSGLFFALMPEPMIKQSARTGIEMDPSTARITKLLFPNAHIRAEDFTKARLPEKYDLAIGNPPFSDRTVRSEDPAGRLHMPLHDYFIARSIERLRPGGIAAFVTSRYTMDKGTETYRAHIASMADLVAAIRLPEGSMAAAAGTDVVVDILFLQKRAADQGSNDILWSSLEEAVPAEDGEEPLLINRYFSEHPDMVLGKHARTSGPYGPTYTCQALMKNGLPEFLQAAIESLPRALYKAPSEAVPLEPNRPRVQVGSAADGATIKEGSYLVLENQLMQIIDGLPQPIEVRQAKGTDGIPANHARIIRALIPIRDAVRAVLRAQEANEPWGAAQARLRIAYNTFLRDFGPINLTTIAETTHPETGEIRETHRQPNLHPFKDDPDVWLVSTIENYDLESGKATKGPIFSERVLHPPATPKIENADDALAVTLHETGIVDLDRIAELLAKSREETIAELGEHIYLDPQLTIETIETWQTADAYLSGPIRTKLAAAQGAAILEPRYQRNIAALEKVIPEDLKPSDISARLGAPWIPELDIKAFAWEVLKVDTFVHHTVEVASWSIDLHAFENTPAAGKWGTERRHTGLLMSDALNSSLPQIFDTFKENGVKKDVLNAIETEAAKDKLAKLKEAFENWVWSDAERATRLARIYNDAFNNLVPRHFDGSHLKLPGASSIIKFFSHQLRVIWRIISSGTTYIAHAVGAGKTFSMAASVMEQKRLGLITKAMMVVPGHCLAQASREFLLLYPNARILVADETNFVKQKRQRFLARAATNAWDCIIITHSAFEFIPTPARFERDLIHKQLDSYADLLDKVDSEDRISRKRIEYMKERLEASLKGLQSRKDDLLTIAEIGIDQLIIDEAQEFRKLSFATNQSSLKGIDPEGSQRAWDLYVKTRFIEENKNPGRALILASGSPITNTLGELFTVQRFVQLDALESRGIHEFDAWAANFGETRTELELQPSGTYKPVTRFAQFINVADLMSMYRMVADVVLQADLRQYVKLPQIKTGKRQIITAEATPAFKTYQAILAERIAVIQARKGAPKQGDDIILSVINDGRHAAIDLRFVDQSQEDEPENKLNAMINTIHRIWHETSDFQYTNKEGVPYLKRGAAQMIFSDLGTEAVAETRGFSAYRWIKDRLISLGVPANEIAFIHDYRKPSQKQRLFTEVNAGMKRVLIGSTQMMGTGVNAQLRLIALHHLDVPWLPSSIIQREGRIERQGNQNEEIGIYAYATKGSMDASGWQTLERKMRFIDLAMGGDLSIRKIEDDGSQVNQFAMAKAIASGDPRLMQKAGVEADVARLKRLRDAHTDNCHAINWELHNTKHRLASAETRIQQIELDLTQRTSTRGEDFSMTLEKKPFTERKAAGTALIKAIQHYQSICKNGEYQLATIGGFTLHLNVEMLPKRHVRLELTIQRNGHLTEINLPDKLTALGIISSLEYTLSRFEVELNECKRTQAECLNRIPHYEIQRMEPFTYQAELDEKLRELDELNESLAQTQATA
jgi:N12 class adenine-specific DNA methylase/adenine-specific DNA methylase